MNGSRRFLAKILSAKTESEKIGIEHWKLKMKNF